MPRGVSKRKRRWQSHRELVTGLEAWHRQRVRRRNAIQAMETRNARANHEDEQQEVAPSRLTCNSANTSEHAPSRLISVPFNDDDNDDGEGDDVPFTEDANHQNFPAQIDLSMEGNVQEHQAPQGAVRLGTEHEALTDVLNAETEMQVETNMYIPSALDLKERDKDVQAVLHGCNMSALSVIMGTSRMTVRQYITHRRFVNYERRKKKTKLPSYNTLLYSVYPALQRVSFVNHAYVRESVNVQSSGVTPFLRSEAESGNAPMQTIMVTLPSSWLCRDGNELLRDVRDELQQSRRSKVCTFFESSLQKHGGSLNSCSVICETRLSHGFYEYGRYILPEDLVELRFTLPDSSFRSFLVQNNLVTVEGTTLSLKVVIGSSQIREDGCLGDGLGDITICLRANSHSLRSISLQYRVSGLGGGWTSSLSISASSFVARSARLLSVSLITSRSNASRAAPPLGVLRDGRRYLRVPYLLFTDDFSTMGGRGGSSGGCYIAPILSPAYGRRGMESVHVLGLTTPGVSSNAVLRGIVEDIVECATKGVEILDDDGGTLVLFAEVVAYIGDYPGMSHCLDLLGHNSCAPCTHCCFRRADLNGEEECSMYGYTSSINSAEPSFRRTKKRMRVMRNACDSNDDDLQYIGLKSLSEEQLGKLPLHLLSDKLEAARPHIPLTSELVPVVQNVFDPYQSCAIAPSHVLYGLTKNVMEATIRSCTPLQRAQADKLMFTVLSSIGSTSEHYIITNARLNNMTISNTFAVLAIAPWAFRMVMVYAYSVTVKRPENTTALLLFALYKFRELYVESNFLPLIDRDGQRAVSEMNNSERYFSHLKLLCVAYVDIINQICGLEPDLRRYLDKPNLHRVVELFHHSVPRYGHISVFDELPFEAAHQPLKRALGRSNNAEGQIYSMRCILSNDWRKRVGRVCAALALNEETGELSVDHCRELVKACFGDYESLENGTITNDDVRDAFTPAVIEELCTYVSTARNRKALSAVWTVRKSAKRKRMSSTSSTLSLSAHFDGEETSVRLFLHELQGPSSSNTQTRELSSGASVYAYNSAIRCMVDPEKYSGAKEFLANGVGKSKKYNTIQEGDALQVLLALPQVQLMEMISSSGIRMLPTNATAGVPTYWIVVGLYKSSGCPFIYANVKALILCDDDAHVGPSFEPLYKVYCGPGVTVVRLDEHCTRALLLHCCLETAGCNCRGTSYTTRLYVHNELSIDVLSQGRWTVQGSRHCYPSRTG